MNIQEIFENAKKDPTLLANIDIDELLAGVENTKNDHLDDKTLDDISCEIFQELMELHWTKLKLSKKTSVEILCNKLTNYRLINEIYQIHKGKHVRWIRRTNPKNTLVAGGIVLDIKFLDGGTNIVVRTTSHKCPVLQYKYDECITFQKMAQDELLILMAYELLHP